MKRKNWILFSLFLLAVCGLVIGAAVIGYQDYQVISAPGNPASGYMRLYASGSQLGCKTSSGGNCLSGAGATVPSNCALVESDSTPSLNCQTAKGLASVAYAAGGGSANAQTATYSPAIAAQADILGYPICWLPTAANTGSATFNPSGLGANTIKKAGGSGLVNLAANDLLTTAVGCAIWDGTVYELQNPQTSAGSSITLQTNSTNNSSQTALNLVAGSNVTLTNTSGGNVTIAASSGSGAMTQLGQCVIGTGATGACSIGGSNANVTFSSFSSGYTNLLIVTSCKDNSTNVSDQLQMQLNGDNASHYAFTAIFNATNSTAPSGSGSTGTATPYMGNCGGGTGNWASANIRIPAYSSATAYKLGTTDGNNVTSASGITMFSSFATWFWNNNAAVTSILLFPASGCSCDFASGTIFTLYGLL